MIHFILYSNADHDDDIEPPEEYGIYTKSSVSSVLGSQIWFVSGRDSPKEFRLCYTFTAERIDPLPAGEPGSRVSGVTGAIFDPPVRLNDETWFAELRRTQFWSLGLFEVKSPEVVEGLIALLESIVSDDTLPELSDVVTDLESDIAASLTLSHAERLDRLKSAPRHPALFEVVTTAYERNPDVIAEVLHRANGVCEKCGSSAPFTRKSDGTPYLEVHHWKPLSEDGEDTVENAGALCPNCHREAHFG